MTQELITKIAIFQKKEVRKIIHNNEWWFSIIDVIEALTGTERPRKYWNDLKTKLIKEGYSEVSENIGQLKIIASDGKKERQTVPTQKLFFVLSNQSHHRKPSHLNDGWLELAMNEYRKLKILN